MRDRIVWHQPEAQQRVYYVTTDLVARGPMLVQRPWSALDADRVGEFFGAVGSMLVQALLETPGVYAVQLAPYTVHIVKGVAFLWEEVHPAVLAVLQGQFLAPAQVLERSQHEVRNQQLSSGPFGSTPGYPGSPFQSVFEQLTRMNPPSFQCPPFSEGPPPNPYYKDGDDADKDHGG